MFPKLTLVKLTKASIQTSQNKPNILNSCSQYLLSSYYVHSSVCVCACAHACTSHSVVSNALRPYGMQPTSLLFHGILQARILEQVAIPFSRRSPNPAFKSGSLALKADCLPSESPWKPYTVIQDNYNKMKFSPPKKSHANQEVQ